MIVMKIGGSSLRNVESLKKVVDLIIREDDPEKIVVLSAVNGVTNHLFKSVTEALETERKIASLLDYLKMLHNELAIAVISSFAVRRKVLDEIDYLLSRLEKLLYGIAYTSECTRRTRDLIVSMGERFAVQLLAGCLEDRGQAAVPFDADRIDIVATGEFGYGNAELEMTASLMPEHLKPLLGRGSIPIITGFFGRTPDNHTITFGRGGTDYSAAIVAYAMNARELQVWKDVDGFMTADPGIVPEAKPLGYLAYEEAAELSYFGASILHPRTVEPLAKKRIPAVIKNTYKPETPGTIIGVEKHLHDDVIKSVTFNRKIGALRLHGASIGQQVGFLKKVVTILSNSDINIISVITSQTAVNILLAKEDIDRSRKLIETLSIPYVDHIEPIKDVALIGVVGEGLAETKGLAGRVFTAVANANTNVEMIVSGASKVAQYFIIKESDVEKTIQAIHSEFFSRKH